MANCLHTMSVDKNGRIRLQGSKESALDKEHLWLASMDTPWSHLFPMVLGAFSDLRQKALAKVKIS